MNSRIKCTCGWSWNKSDSSKKDMYICHECGRDNSNNMKNGGWLDNYNDSETSAPEGFEGEGYSNVGRDYSPAWGGQFEEGGEISNAQKGKKVKYVESKNDPRYRAYQDSLNVYNSLNESANFFKNTIEPLFKKDSNSPKARKLWNTLVQTPEPARDNSWDRLEKINKKPLKTKMHDSKYNDKFAYTTFSKPKQPVIVKDERKPNTTTGKQVKENNNRGMVFNQTIQKKPIQAIQNNLQPIGIQNDFNLEAPLSQIRQHVVQPKYYDVEDYTHGSTSYGGTQTNYITDDLSTLSEQTPNNTRKIIPHYQMGGSVYPVNYVPQAQDGYRMGTYFDEDARERETNMMEETYDDYNTAMTGMMKSKMATQAALGNPGAKRMMSNMPAKYIFTGNERFSDGTPAEGAGAYGSHYMSNRDNYVYPNLQDNGEGTLNFIPNASPSDREAMRFENPGEADYFANHYKEVAPMMKHYGKKQMGGSIPGSVGFTYARTQGSAPSNGKYAKKTMASAQNGASIPVIEDIGDFKEGVWVPDLKAMAKEAKRLGVKKVKTKHGAVLHFNDKWEVVSADDNPTAQNGKEMQYYQNGLDFQPKTISRDGSIIKDDRGQWNHPGEITEINSNDITMEGVPYNVLGISDTGDTKLMKPGKNYKFKGKKVTEFPMAKNGLRQEQKGLVNLDQLTNFTNYNKPTIGGWLNKYN